jgi:hypothetical protein
MCDDSGQSSERYRKRIKELEGKLLTPEKRDRILAALEVGKQSPKKVLDHFIKELSF